jgi:hypothetical protein
MDGREKTDILLPLANPENSFHLIDLVNRLYHGKRNITLVHLLSDEGEREKAADLLREAGSGLNRDFTLKTLIETDRDPARSIIRKAKKLKARNLVVGWHGNKLKGAKRGRVLDPVLKKASCSVIIGKGLEQLPPESPRQILVPLCGVREIDVLALKTAESLLERERGGRITILYFKRSPVKLSHIDYLMNEVIRRNNIKLDGIASDSDKPVKTTILQSREFDLVTMGLVEPWLFRKGKPSYSERVALEHTGTLLMIRTPRPIHSRINFFT